MQQTNNTNQNEIFPSDFSKKARAFQKEKEKEKTPEFLKWKKEAAIYLRISSEMQRDGFSIDAQKRDCKNYIESAGFHLAEENIFIDEAHTAKNEERPAFNHLIKSAYMGKFSLIVIHKSDRFERNLSNQINTIRELMELGVVVYSYCEHKEITNDIYCQMMGMWNEHYVNNLSEEVKKGKHAMARKGYFLGSKVPFGYRRWESKEDGYDRRRLVVVEKEAAAVKEIFEMYLTGRYSMADLAKYLNDSGFRNYRGSLFGEETIRSMLENIIYCGFVIYNNRATREVEKYPGTHEPIISIELFNKMSAYRAQKADRYSRQVSNGEKLKNHYLVQSLVCCAECGHRLRVRNRTDGSYTYFDCAEKSGLVCSMNGKSIVASRLDKIIENFLNNIELPKNWMDTIKNSSSHENAVKQIHDKIRAIEAKMKRREYTFIEGLGDMSPDEYKKAQMADQNEIAELKKRLPKGSPELNTQITVVNSLIDLFQIATKAEQYDIVHFLFKNLYFDFAKRRLTAFEPNPDYEFLFTSFAEDKGWIKDDKVFRITR